MVARLYKQYTTSADGGRRRRPTEKAQQKIQPQFFNPMQVFDLLQLVDPM